MTTKVIENEAGKIEITETLSSVHGREAVKPYPCDSVPHLWCWFTEKEWWYRLNLVYDERRGQFGKCVGRTNSSGVDVAGSRIPSANGEYWGFDGHAGQPAGLYFYDDSGKRPDLKIGFITEPALLIRNCHDLTVSASVEWAGTAVKVENSHNCAISVQAKNVGDGVLVEPDCSGIVVFGSRVINYGCVGIKLNATDCAARDNVLVNGGQSESIAGIYLASKSVDCVAAGNVVSKYTHGLLWRHDGCAIFTENRSRGNTVINNTASHMYVSWKDNSGMPGNVFAGNRQWSVEKVFIQSDSKGYGQADTIFV